MKVNVVSFSSSGGAGNVANSLVTGLQRLGFQARLIVATDSNLRSAPFQLPALTASAVLDNFVLRSPSWPYLISSARDSHSVIRGELEASDLTVFRWMNGLLGQRFLRLNNKLSNVVWALDDMNPFTGVCHYSGNCEGFKSGCSNCPALRAPFSSDLAKSNLSRKIAFSERLVSSYVAPTDWIQAHFLNSELGRGRSIQKIYNPLNDMFFEAHTRSQYVSGPLRLLVVAANLDDPIKGIWETSQILDGLSRERGYNLTFVGKASKRLMRKIPHATFMGSLTGTRILDEMRRNHLLIVPSLFENAGTVVAEASSQGLPTIARNTGGMPEMTGYGEFGYLFNQADDFSSVLKSIDSLDLRRKSRLAKEWAQGMKPELIAQKYADEFL